MKYFYIASIALLLCSSVSSQSIGELTFGTDTTLEIATWNINNFPKNGQATATYVSQLIKSLDIDVIAFQELADTVQFKKMLGDLSGFKYSFVASRYGGLAYIYKHSTVKINGVYDIYSSTTYRSPFPRPPLVMDLNYAGQRYYIINNHLKCCGDGTLNLNLSTDEEYRRYYASNLLKNYIDNNLPKQNVLLLGDLNDDIAEPQPNNVFDGFISDSLNYLFADMKIAKGGINEWSYPSWPSHLDHIMISNELFSAFYNKPAEIKTLKIDDFLTGGWQTYYTQISDHRPVALKLLPNVSTSAHTLNKTTKVSFYNYPNPFQHETKFLFDEINTASSIEILNVYGQVVNSIQLDNGQTEAIWNAANLQSGIYFAQLISGTKIIADAKLILMK